MFHHHDIMALLPDANSTCVSQEDGRDEPPCKVFAGILIQGRNGGQTQWEVLRMGLYVSLVLLQVESVT
jgi:hypothetical protein